MRRVSLGRLNTLLERFVSDVRAAALSNGGCLRGTDPEYAFAHCQIILLSETAFEIPPPSILRIGGRTCTNHTVPCGTALWGGAVPGTSCLATIILSRWGRNRFRAKALIN